MAGSLQELCHGAMDVASQTTLVCTPMWHSIKNGLKGSSIREKTSFEKIHSFTLEKTVVGNETCTRNDETSVGILVTNVYVCVFVMSNLTSQKMFMVLRRNVFDMKSDSSFFIKFKY